MAIFKNESMNLREWIDHYKWQGVERFYLIDNDSCDNPFLTLSTYEDDGSIVYFSRPKKSCQIEHYREIYPLVRKECQWCLIADLDEFWYVSSGQSLAEQLRKEKDDCHIIYSNWVMFGSSGFIEHPKKIRVSFTYRWPLSIVTQQKYVFRTEKVHPKQIFVHYIAHHGVLPFKTDNQNYVVNHYAIQSLEYFTKIKMTRGDVQSTRNPRDLDYFSRYDRQSTDIDTRLHDILLSSQRVVDE